MIFKIDELLIIWYIVGGRNSIIAYDTLQWYNSSLGKVDSSYLNSILSPSRFVEVDNVAKT